MGDRSAPNDVVVTGDVTMDWNLVRCRKPEEQGAIWSPELCSRVCWQRGGAALLADLVEAVAQQNPSTRNLQIRQPEIPRRKNAGDPAPLGPDDPRFRHAYASWLPYPYSTDKADEKTSKAWRIHEYLGINACSTDEKPGELRVVNDTGNAGIVILDDANLGFRDNPDLWPKSITDPSSLPWVVLKMTRPIARGPLWKHLCARHADRLIVVMTVNDLRLSEVQISRELSWERTAQDLAWEIVYNLAIQGLKECAHVVVSFQAAGAFLYSRGGQDSNPHSRLLSDPEVVEGMWESKYEGRLMGYTACLTAGIARQVMLNPDQPDIEKGVRTGLAGLRKLHLEGYGQRGAAPEKVRLEFPVSTVAAALDETATPFVGVDVPVRMEGKFWTILDDTYKDDLKQIAQEIVLQGPKKVLSSVPLGRFGGLLTVDRQEIESLRSIRSLVSEYAAQVHPKRPLSIAVFGPPGSGKSFGITQLASALMPGEIEVVEFNLSQFGSTEELLSALQRVRDIGLSGKMPLVFWDEFDSAQGGDECGWLRHFLAPMQDGKFLHGGHVHPIGRAIFVFAGGTCETLQQFGKDSTSERRKARKVPDFISRLRGHLNVLGPNPRKEQGAPEDKYFILRRAILLQSMLSREAKQLQPGSIDKGVLRALLETRVYRHGARSMESIIATSQLAGKTHFERSSLPSEAQLDTHVDGQEFLALVQLLEFDASTLETMAKKVHDLFCEDLRDNGYRYGPVTNDQEKTHGSLVEYAQLREDEKQQNRDQVRQIPLKLATEGYYMIPARTGAPPVEFAKDELERLAAMEHLRWMKAKIDAEWRYDPKTDKNKHLHECLLPWNKSDPPLPEPYRSAMGSDELPDKEKEKDRNAVRNIGQILHTAGFTIVKAREKYLTFAAPA